MIKNITRIARFVLFVPSLALFFYSSVVSAQEVNSQQVSFSAESFTTEPLAIDPLTIDPLTIAVASNFKPTMEKIAERYQQMSGEKVRIIGASSGVLYQQIRRQAPFDLFFSADRKRPESLFSQGLATSIEDYAQGRLALFSKQTSIDDLLLNLPNQNQCSLAIANPEAAPYGQLAQQYLAKQVQFQRCKVVTGANIAQAFQYTDMQHVNLGFVAYSHIVDKQIAPEFYQLLPDDLLLTQSYAVIKKDKPHPDRDSFIHFLHSQTVQQLITDSGYLLPIEPAMKLVSKPNDTFNSNAILHSNSVLDANTVLDTNIEASHEIK